MVMGIVSLLLVTTVCSAETINNVAQPWQERKPNAAQSLYEQTITGTNSVISDKGEVSGVVAAGIGSREAATSPPRRLSVSILWFENRAGSQAKHWRHGIEGSLWNQIGQVKVVRLRRGVEYARQKLGIEEGSALNADQARKIGELIEAQRVIWGSYQRRDDKWQVSVYLLNVATGEVSDLLTAASTDWYDIRDNLTEQILGQLKIKPSEEEKKKLIRRGTTSPQALEWSVKAYALQAEGRPLSELEECVRRAIAADPLYANSYWILATVLGSQGEFEQAEEMVRRALEIRPDSASAHYVLGTVLIQQREYSQAENELQEALRLRPDNAEALCVLAQLYGAQGKWDKTIVYDEKAVIQAPMDASIHAHLGLAYAHKRDRNKAMAALKEAERLTEDSTANINAEQMLCLAYELLGEVHLAVAHYEMFVTMGRKEGVYPEMVSAFERKAEILKATLTPTFVETSVPKIYTEWTLQDKLRKRLTAEEQSGDKTLG
jgi:tetratricopeptide (TPR) repeat protein